MKFRVFWRVAVDSLVAAALCCAAAGSAFAQGASTSGPNSGALTFSGGLDVPTLYIFRGIVQEGDPRLTLAPYGDLGIALVSGDGPGSVRVHVGVWNSLNTGSSGTGGPLKALHYAEQFHATLTVGLGMGLTLTPGFLANSSPNRSYNTIKEINLTLARSGRIAPYGLVAFELSDTGQLDGGSKKGTYLELGAGPRLGLPFLHASLTVPAKAGFSLSNYYELFGGDLQYHDSRFGFFQIGGLVTVPISWVAPRFGSWNIHGGADVFRFGTTTQAFNQGDKGKVVGLVGVGVTY